MKLELALLAGAESKAFLASLTQQIDRLEKLAGKVVSMSGSERDEDPAEDAAEEFGSDEEPMEVKPAKVGKGKKAAASLEEDEMEPQAEADEPFESDEDEEDFTTPAPASRKAKPAKLTTIADVNDACKAYAKSVKAKGKDGRAAVLKVLKAKFKTESVSDIKPEFYAQVIAAMAVK